MMASQLIHKERLQGLADLLQTYRPLWEQRPFVGLPVPWEAKWPSLAAKLRTLSVEQLTAYEANPLSIPGVDEICPELIGQLRQFNQLPNLDAVHPLSEPKRPDRVDARKWSQVVRFVSAVSGEMPPNINTCVDWCAGKGVLGREISQQLNKSVICVEINKGLCQTGIKEAKTRGLDVSFVCADVLNAQLWNKKQKIPLGPNTGVAALHACGHLNAKLLRLVVAQSVGFLAIVPCCYQRIDGMQFTPMSSAALATGLTFTRHQLRIPALDEVSISEQKKAHRKRENAFRQGTDLLIRQATGKDVYTPLGKVAPHVIRGPFKVFAQTAAAGVNIELSNPIDWVAAESAGWERNHLVSALSVTRRLFRRAMEVWLFLDRVCFLEEHGYQVKIGTLCPREITPRNLLLMASKV